MSVSPDIGAATLRLLRRLAPALMLAGILLALVLLSTIINNDDIERTVTETLIRIVMVVALYTFVGNSGVVSFGSVAFVSIGAYASAWQTCCSGLKAMTMTGLPDFLRLHTYPVLPATIASGALAAGAGLVAGIPIMRLSDIPSSIATFAFLAIIYIFYSNWDSVTLGLLSVVGLPLAVNAWIAFAWSAVTILVTGFFQTSRFGITLRATREDEVAARAGGINIARQRLIAWVISAFFLGVSGALYGDFIGVISVSSFYLDLTFLTLAMLVVGGARSLTGAVVGTVVLSTVSEILRRFEEGLTFGTHTVQIPAGSQEVALGLIMLILLLLRPRGLTGGREFLGHLARIKPPRLGV